MPAIAATDLWEDGGSPICSISHFKGHTERLCKNSPDCQNFTDALSGLYFVNFRQQSDWSP